MLGARKVERQKKSRQNHTEFAYNGIVKCAKCGCDYTGEAKFKKKKDGTSKKYIYYHCTGNRGGNCKKDSYISIVFRTLLKSVFAILNRYVWLCV